MLNCWPLKRCTCEILVRHGGFPPDASDSTSLYRVTTNNGCGLPHGPMKRKQLTTKEGQIRAGVVKIERVLRIFVPLPPLNKRVSSVDSDCPNPPPAQVLLKKRARPWYHAGLAKVCLARRSGLRCSCNQSDPHFTASRASGLPSRRPANAWAS